MTKWMLLAALALAAPACKDDFDKAMSEAEEVTDKLCACKDTACADKVREERREVKKRFKASLEGKKPSADQMKRADKVDDRWRTCAAKLDG